MQKTNVEKPESRQKLESKRKTRFRQKMVDEGLVPDPLEPGVFVKKSGDDGNTIKHLYPNNWVYHESVVEKVLKGDYTGIMPYSGEFVTTLNCSNRCRIPCSFAVQRLNEEIAYENDLKNPRVHMKSVSFAKGVADNVIDAGVKGLIFTGGGEPFMFQGLEEVIEHVSARGVDTVLYSNGNAIADDMKIAQRRVERIFSARPKMIRLSMNCGSESVYTKYHNPFDKNAYNLAWRNLVLIAHEAARHPDVSVGVGVIINKINKYDLTEVALRVREVVDGKGRIDFVTYRPAFNYYGGVQLSPEFLDETYGIVESGVRPILSAVGVRVTNIQCRYEQLKAPQRAYKKCRASGLYVEVSPPGEFGLCSDRNCHRAYVIGDASKDSTAKIWSGEKRTRLIEDINYDECNSCPPGCKPHENNVQFEKIEKLREKGRMYLVELWIEEQQKMEKPKMVNF